MKADEVGKVQAALLGEFQGLAKVSDFALAWAVFEAAATDAAPQPESLRLWMASSATGSRGRSTWKPCSSATSPNPPRPGPRGGASLPAVAFTEKAATHAEAFPFLAGPIAEAFQKAHDGQVRFWATGYASAREAEELLAAAAREAESLLRSRRH